MVTASPEVSVRGLVLIDQGRVRITTVHEGRIEAKVVGSTGRYTVRRSATGRWSCDCEAGQFGRACSHREAVRLVTEG
jgi:uncharacterized Zn finger protein